MQLELQLTMGSRQPQGSRHVQRPRYFGRVWDCGRIWHPVYGRLLAQQKVSSWEMLSFLYPHCQITLKPEN